MTGRVLTHRKDAHYHAVKATREWQNFMAAMAEVTHRAATQRLATDRERERETTYARGTLGGS